MNELKSTTLELTINTGYVSNWGFWEAAREVLQNALDAHDQGYTMSVTRGKGANPTVYIRNEGVSLDRRALLLGTTSKDGGGFRGKFGEGLKLALLVLARKGVPVKVRTGKEMWTPFIESSAAFGGAELLKIKISPTEKHEEKVEIQIQGLDDEVWNLVQERLIDIPGMPKTKASKDDVIDLNGPKILTAERFKGKLFCRGLYVGNLPDQYTYGYDLPDVQLDRDRRMFDPWSLRTQLSNTLAKAVTSGALSGERVMQLLGSDSGEATAIAARYENGGEFMRDELSKSVTKAFKEKHGEDAVPVSFMSESLEAEHHGMKGKMVSKAVKHLIETEEGSFESRKKNQGTLARKLYGVEELTTEELSSLHWAVRLIAFAEPTFDLSKLQVVDFYSETIFGTYNPGQIRVAKRVLADRRELLATIVHEVAHGWGKDGSASHERKIEQIFAEIVVRLQTPMAV